MPSLNLRVSEQVSSGLTVLKETGRHVDREKINHLIGDYGGTILQLVNKPAAPLISAIFALLNGLLAVRTYDSAAREWLIRVSGEHNNRLPFEHGLVNVFLCLSAVGILAAMIASVLGWRKRLSTRRGKALMIASSLMSLVAAALVMGVLFRPKPINPFVEWGQGQKDQQVTAQETAPVKTGASSSPSASLNEPSARGVGGDIRASADRNVKPASSSGISFLDIPLSESPATIADKLASSEFYQSDPLGPERSATCIGIAEWDAYQSTIASFATDKDLLRFCGDVQVCVYLRKLNSPFGQAFVYCTRDKNTTLSLAVELEDKREEFLQKLASKYGEPKLERDDRSRVTLRKWVVGNQEIHAVSSKLYYMNVEPIKKFLSEVQALKDKRAAEPTPAEKALKQF